MSYKSEVGRLLGLSKLSQISQTVSNKRVPDPSKAAPTTQIIEALPGAAYRRDYGLKVPVPTKVKTRYITINEIDNKYRLPEYELNNRFMYKKQKFQEMGVPVTFTNQSKNSAQWEELTASPSSALFPGNAVQNAKSHTVSSVLGLQRQPLHEEMVVDTIKNLKNLRKPFYKWLAQKYPEQMCSTDLKSEVVEFLSEYQAAGNKIAAIKSRETIPEYSKHTLSGTAGLSYLTKGRLACTPNGISAQTVQPGRYIDSSRRDTTFGVAGFTGSSFKQSASAIGRYALNEKAENLYPRDVCVPLIVKNVTLDLQSKKLGVEVDPVTQPPAASDARGNNSGILSSKRTNNYGNRQNLTTSLDNLLRILK